MHPPLDQPVYFSTQISEARRFYLDMNPPKSIKLAVLSGGLEFCTADYEIHRKGFPFFGMEYVARGRGELILKGRKFALGPGDIFSYGPGVDQDIATDPKVPLVKYFVDFTGSGAVPLMRSCQLQPGRLLRVHPPNALQSLFDEMILCGTRLARGEEKLVVKLLECVVLRIDGARAPLRGAETLAFATYQTIRQRIEADFLKLRSLDQICDECHVSAAYICRLFRRYDGRSPYQFLLRLKMNHAAERIREAGIMVKHVADETGFDDPFHFSRAFKSVLGLSPSAFRDLK